jgi:hypothetical protein
MKWSKSAHTTHNVDSGHGRSANIFQACDGWARLLVLLHRPNVVWLILTNFCGIYIQTLECKRQVLIPKPNLRFSLHEMTAQALSFLCVCSHEVEIIQHDPVFDLWMPVQPLADLLLASAMKPVLTVREVLRLVYDLRYAVEAKLPVQQDNLIRPRAPG